MRVLPQLSGYSGLRAADRSPGAHPGRAVSAFHCEVASPAPGDADLPGTSSRRLEPSRSCRRTSGAAQAEGEATTTQMPHPVPGADDIHLRIDVGAVVLWCASHPEFSKSFAYGEDRTVPAVWLASELAAHLEEHVLAAEQEPAGQTAVMSGLDPFSAEIATPCTWAMRFNEGDPDDKWELPFRLAVALVLLNFEYLEDIGPGPGYTPEQAMLLLYSGMTHPPADFDGWMLAIRDAIRHPGQQLRVAAPTERP
jgi:hypothetical protein